VIWVCDFCYSLLLCLCCSFLFCDCGCGCGCGGVRIVLLLVFDFLLDFVLFCVIDVLSIVGVVWSVCVE